MESSVKIRYGLLEKIVLLVWINIPHDSHGIIFDNGLPFEQ